MMAWSRARSTVFQACGVMVPGGLWASRVMGNLSACPAGTVLMTFPSTIATSGRALARVNERVVTSPTVTSSSARSLILRYVNSEGEG